MTFPEAYKSAVEGERITRPERVGHYLTFKEGVGLILNSDDPSKTPCRWVGTPQDLESVDWTTAPESHPATVSMKPGRITVSEPRSVPRCLFCGQESMMDVPCRSCQHQLMLALAPAMASVAYGKAADSDMVARDIKRTVDSLMAVR